MPSTVGSCPGGISQFAPGAEASGGTTRPGAPKPPDCPSTHTPLNEVGTVPYGQSVATAAGAKASVPAASAAEHPRTTIRRLMCL